MRSVVKYSTFYFDNCTIIIIHIHIRSRSSQCSTTGVTRPWYVLSCLWDGAYKRTLAVNR